MSSVPGGGLNIAAAQAQTPPTPVKNSPKDPVMAAKASLQSNTLALAKITLPEDLEPAFSFHS